MGHSARKARKKAGVKFERQPKAGTPLADRSFFAGAMIFDPKKGWRAPSLKKRIRALKARGIDTSAAEAVLDSE
jgi:pimeloyl-CoA synthetase